MLQIKREGLIVIEGAGTWSIFFEVQWQTNQVDSLSSAPVRLRFPF